MPFFFLLLLLNHNQTLTPTGIPPPPPPLPRIGQFKPGIAVIVALLTTIFSVTFLLLLYMKLCKGEAYVGTSSYYQTTPLGRNSGVDRKVIESLPVFRFSSLTGQKDGLECAVCLNRFDADEVLRLLPKCKHAFHVECVDTWLDAHSTCPLCRYRVDPEDVLLVDSRIPYNATAGAATPRSSNQGNGKEYTNPRISGRHSSAGERGTTALEIISENPPPGHDFRGRISLDSWHTTRRKSGNPKPQNPDHNGTLNRKTRKDGQLLAAQKENHRRLEHRIVISSGADLEAGTEESRRRWSDAQAAEILYLKSEMMITGGGGRGVNNERSVSEITGVSRYVSNNGGGKQQGQDEERAVRRWLDWISSQSHSQFQLHSQTPPTSASSSSSSSTL